LENGLHLLRTSNGPIEVWKAVSYSLALHVTALLTVYSVFPTFEPVQFGGENEVLEIESAFVSDSSGDVVYEPPVTTEPMDVEESERDYLPPTQAEPSAVLQRMTSQSVVEPDWKPADQLVTQDQNLVQQDIIFRKPTSTPEPVTRRPELVRVSPMPSSATTTITGLDETLPPLFKTNTAPEYPAQAVRLRLEGEVMLELRVTVDGRVKDVKVLRSSGHEILDRAAVKAVKGWKGQPAMRRGQAVETVERLPIRFRL
jgi:TonB family protein